MTLTPLRFTPGIVRDQTRFSNEGGWWDGDKVRFSNGLPETIGGWTKLSNSTFLGTCRSLHPWTALNGTNYTGVGTHLKFYVLKGTAFNDVTPIRSTTAAGDVTFSATSGSATLTVTDSSHGAVLGDFVTFSGAVSLGGNVTADVLNAEHQIASIVDSNSYTITLSVTANVSDTGNGGASVIGAYQINVGLDSSVFGTGWGTGGWGEGGWGEGSDTSIAGAQLRLWSQDNFGEDLLMNVRDGGIYYWDASGGVASRAVALSDVAGSQSAPTVARKVLVSDRDRHILAFACDDETAIGTQDPLLIRFSDQESLTEWRTLSTTTAGSLRIGSGSQIITAVETKQQVLVFTDVSMHTLQYVGPPFTYGITEIATGTSIISQNSAVSANDVVYWMGKGDFYLFDGTVRTLPCPVSDYVFDRISTAQQGKVFGAHNADFSEVWWFYPKADDPDTTGYVAFDYGQQIWHIGDLDRTAWMPRGVLGYPVAAGMDGYLYYHEFGVNDGSTNPPSAISSYIESAPFDLDNGDRTMLLRRVLPDITFRNSTGTPTATLTLKAGNFPGGGYGSSVAGSTVQTATVPVEQFTTVHDLRLRGRTMSLRVESNLYNTAWQLGVPRIEIRPDGRRG